MKHIYLILLIIVIASLLGGSVWLLSAQVPRTRWPVPDAATPKITWSPRTNVYAGITSTTTVSMTLTFVSDQALQNAVAEAVPEISRFVQIQPAMFAQVPANQPQTVHLVFNAPTGAQYGAYDGTIHIRVGTSTLPATLKASVTFAVVTLPPDPGEAGKTTLAGIDADGDGVRDDVQRWIAFTHPTSAKTRAALSQSAVAFQAEIAGSNSFVQQVMYATDCISATLMTGDADVIGGKVARDATSVLQAAVLNTPQRTAALVNAESRLRSVVIVATPFSQQASHCLVNPGSLPN